jgi:hypothetical protein
MDSSKIRRRVGRPALIAIGVTILLVSSVMQAYASHPEASLAGSNFEIDVDANLKQDDPAPSIDWASVTEIRATDKVNGTGDDSYAGGVKEDTVCPAATTDSIPPNKSDLLSFHVYREPGVGTHPGFLNMAWSRVTEPTGTTLMDFEFNKSSTKCASGPNVVRTVGDLLIEYSIDQGGSRADITGRTWTGTAWGAPQDLDSSTACGGGPCATGTINSSPIPAGESDGLGAKSARTFGEAQIDLRLLFQSDKCASFGSAMLKSRSSDSFTSQLKDFVAPVPINIANCGQVIIRKQTNPQLGSNSPDFGYTKNFATDPTSVNTFLLKDDGVKDYGKTVLFGSNYTVIEDVIPTNWVFVSLDCSASSAGTSFSTSGATVTFAIDSDTDVLDCTYTNKLNQGAILVTKTRKHAADGPGPHAHAGVTFTVDGVSKQTDANGQACFGGLTFGSHDVIETVPAGYVADGATTKSVLVDNSATCSDNPYVGETVGFSNTPLTDLTVSVNSQVDGGTASTVDCVVTDSDPADEVLAFDTGTNGDGTATTTDLQPQSITCTIVIDP